MRDFHRTWYQPRSMTAVAVGNLPVDTLISVVADAFEQAQLDRYGDSWAIASDLSLKQFEPWAPLQPEAPFDSIRRADYADASLQQARLIMSWRVPGLSTLEETYGLDVLASVLSHGRTARLVRDLRNDAVALHGHDIRTLLRRGSRR